MPHSPNAKPRIGILIGSLEKGGAQRMALRLLDELVAADYEAFLINLDATGGTLPDVDEERREALARRILRLSRAETAWPTAVKALMMPWQWFMLRCTASRLHLDVLLSFMERSNILSLSSGFAGSRIVCIRSHPANMLAAKSALKRRLILSAYPRLLRRADRIVLNSSEAAANLSRLFEIDTERVMVVPNFCDPERALSQSRQPPEVSPEIFSRPVVIASGRMIRDKGHASLIRAFVKLAEKFPEAHLAFLGDGPLEPELRRLVAELGLSDRVRFLGFQSNPFPYVARATLFVLPSLREGFPNALLEAMALGTPVVAADCRSGPRELLAPDSDPEAKTETVDYAPYGVLTPPLDADADGAAFMSRDLSPAEGSLAEAMGALLSDPKLRARYAEAARTRARDFAPRVVMQQWMALLERL